VHVWTAVIAGIGGLAAGLIVDWSISRYLPDGSRRRLLIVVLSTGLLFAALGLRLGPVAALPAFLYLAGISVALTPIDMALQRLPDPFTLPSYLVGAALLGAAIPFTDAGGPRAVYAVIGLAAMWLIYALQYYGAQLLFNLEAIGFGDVKLSGVLGLYLGWLGYDAWMFGLLGGFFTGGIVSVIALITRKKGRKSHIPFGPFMLIGALGAILLAAGA
jgi:prepilin signal peptidase PulO-like enzyme (type II secretory pathway)